MIHVNTSILIDGVAHPIEAGGVRIHSPFNNHHTFEVLVPLSQSDQVGIPDIKSMLGEPVRICIRPVGRRGPACHFTGLVDEICPTWSSQGRMLALKGYSPTILLDTAPVFRTLKNVSLEQFVRQIIDGRFDAEIQPCSEVIPWRLQPQLTDYQMLLALCDEYNKIITYDGTKMIFGDLGTDASQEITLHQGTDLLSLRLSLNLCPLDFRVRGYDHRSDKDLPPAASNGFFSRHALVSAAVDKAAIYPPAEIFWSERVEDEAELHRHTRRIETRQVHELVVLHGQSNQLALKVGSIIAIDTDDDLLEGSFEGRYLVLQVDHQVNQHSYYNTFMAVPLDHPYPIRMMTARHPIAGPRLARVRAVEDAELGLLQVTFVGDPENNISTGMPALTAFTSDGGAYTLPQPGELVVVLFENFNPQKPLIVGSLFFGAKKAGRWKGKRGFALGDVVFEVDNHGNLTLKGSGRLDFIFKEIHLNSKR